jgi:hypothetical protein
MPLVPTPGTILFRCRGRIGSTHRATGLSAKSRTVGVFHPIQLRHFHAMSEKFTDFFAHYFNPFSYTSNAQLSH